MIVKCSHCKAVLTSKEFESHKCDLPIKGCEIIEVVSFRDDSFGDKKIMSGHGIDGVLYTFEVVPRKPIPFVLSSSDDGYHDPKTDGKLPEPFNKTIQT